VASDPQDAGPVPPAPPAPDSWSQHEWPRSQPWRWVIAGVAGILVVALLAWTVVGNGGREPRRADQASPAVTDPPAPATQADIESAVADISDFVAQEEGEPF
jgi:hypothetical protein